MRKRATLYMTGLGLLAGTLAIAPAAQAQIQVTGGDTTGEASFFVPETDAPGNVRLFDVGIDTLTLETENGVTSNSVFVPTAAGFEDADSSGTPSAGDTGTLRGELSGVAFTSDGTPVPFTGRPTAINFTLDSFGGANGDEITALDGTLIRSQEPGAAPLLFLPGIDNDNVELDDSETFESIGGELQLGAFEASVNDGIIALPTSLEFRDSGNEVPDDVPILSLTRRIKFEFEGEDVDPVLGTDFNFVPTPVDDGTDTGTGTTTTDTSTDDGGDDVATVEDSIRFVGGVNHRFTIQSIGTQASQEFQIRGEIGAVDILLDNISAADFKESDVLINPVLIEETGEVDPTSVVPTSYRVRGESTGVFMFFDVDEYAFASTGESRTNFRFEQGDSRLEGRSEGPVSFYAVAGLDGSINFDDFDGFDYGGDDFFTINVVAVNLSYGSAVPCYTCYSPSLNIDQDIEIGDVVINVGHPIVVPRPPATPGRQPDDDSNSNAGGGSGGGGSDSSIRVVRVFGISPIILVSSGIVSTDLFVLSGSASSAFYQYSYLSSYRYYVYSNISTTYVANQIRIETVDLGSDRYFVVTRSNPGLGLGLGLQRQALVAYQQIGPGCRIFPGLIGLQEVALDDLSDDLDEDIYIDEDSVSTVDDSNDSVEVDDSLDDSSDDAVDDNTSVDDATEDDTSAVEDDDTASNEEIEGTTEDDSSVSDDVNDSTEVDDSTEPATTPQVMEGLEEI
jgi:hypothetical protein